VNTTHELDVRLLDPEEGTLAQVVGTIRAEGTGPLKAKHIGEDAVLVVVAELSGTPFEHEGRHMFRFSLDGEPIAERTLAVVLDAT
jgi:hypothetical protein